MISSRVGTMTFHFVSTHSVWVEENVTKTFKKDWRKEKKQRNKGGLSFTFLEIVNWIPFLTQHKKQKKKNPSNKSCLGTSLVVQWLRICLPMQGTRVRALVQEDPTCCKATKPIRHSYWACALEPASHNYWALLPRLLKPVLHSRRSHRNEKHVRRGGEWPPARRSWREPARSKEDPTQPQNK